MSDDLYEGYKDALRRGHVAALRGRLDAALVAYAEAAGIAPDRALPHASRGGVLLRLDRPADALGAYDAALQRTPRDEAALGGRADALAALGRRVDAAHTLDVLADLQEAAGRLPEACDTARRALELAESRARRHHVSALAQRLRDVPADAAAAAALERALGMLEPMTVPPPGPPPAGGAHAAATGEAALPDAAETELPDGSRLGAEAEDRLDQGDAAGARDALVAAATAYRAAGRVDAALDACYLALAVAPADTELHLILTRLYLDRGWRTPATDKLRLLDRLAELSADKAARTAVRGFIAELANEPDEAGVST